jgi:hypothetical protein
MPHFSNPDLETGEVYIFCCRPVNGVWKIHKWTGKGWERVNTHLPETSIECSPVATVYEGICHLSFIGEENISGSYCLFHICDVNENQPPVKVCEARVGFAKPYLIGYASHRGPITLDSPAYRTTITCNDLEFLYRLSFNPYDPTQIYISGQKYDETVVSRIYNQAENKLYDVIADGDVAYKMALNNNDIYYAKRIGKDFEDRQVFKAANVQYKEIPIDLLTIEEEYYPATYKEDEEFE